MSGPVVKLQNESFWTRSDFSNAAAHGLAALFQAGSKAAEFFPHDAAGLLQILHHRIQVAKYAGRRGRWIGERLYNRISGEDPDYIPMSGTHLRQTLPLVGMEAPDVLVASGKYLLRLDVAEDARARLLSKRDKSGGAE